MAEPSDWRSYRCPVCGHTEGADLGEGVARVSCSHCGTALDLVVRGDGTAAAAVAEPARRRRPDREPA